MKKVFQTIIDRGDGDCMRACVSSILDLTIEQVPHFRRFDKMKKGNAVLLLMNFFEWMGWQYEGNRSIYKDTEGITLNYPEMVDSIDGYFLATVKSRTFDDNTTHMVVIDNTGLVVHDPNIKNPAYQNENIIENKECLYWFMFSKMKEK